MRIVNLTRYLPKLSHFIKRGDRFLVVEILKHLLRVSAVKADLEGRRIYLVKSSRQYFDGVAPLPAILENLKKVLAPFGNLAKYNLVLNLNSKLATTLHAPVALVREHSRAPIDEADLDNLISQAIWKFYDRQRGKVAAKMGISDLDVLLSDVQVKGIKLDGHKVVNPLGFSAKSVEVHLNATFASRALINELKTLLPKEKIIFIGEDGATWAHLLSRLHPEPVFLAVNVFPQETALFRVKDASLGYLDSFDWGEESLKNSVASQLNVPAGIAGEIITRYARGEVSEYFTRRFEKLLSDELQIFANGLEGFLERAGAKTAYIQPFFHLPPMVFSSSFRSRFSRSVRLLPVSNNLISEKLNFDLILNKEGQWPNAFAALSGILLSKFYHSSEHISKIARRRIRWLL